MSRPQEQVFSAEAGISAHDAGSLVRRSPRITREDVFRAADELLIEGNRPTIDRVRMRLGRGSPNTINDHLDAWWARLGSRLRDLPSPEIPQLPGRVSQTLQDLWNQALESAHEALRATAAQQEQQIAQREQSLADWGRQLDEREQAAAGRQAALEESLQMAREQLALVNRTVAGLEASLVERNIEQEEARARIEALDATCADLQKKIEAQASAHQNERTQLQERHAAAEARWLTEVDRAREALKDTQQEHAHALAEQRRQAIALQGELDQLRQREQALADWERKLKEREAAAAGRQAALEENLQMAREQLAVANRSVEGLENALRERDAEQAQTRAWIEALNGSFDDLQRRFHARSSAHESDLKELQEQHAAAEARWIQELDRARQALETEQEQSRSWIEALNGSCDDLQRRFHATTSSHDSERRELQKQHAAAESRWAQEVDRARQALEQAQLERDQLRKDLSDAQAKIRNSGAGKS